VGATCKFDVVRKHACPPLPPLDALHDLKMAYPKTTGKRRRASKAIRKGL
jgi:hypothetical protein